MGPILANKYWWAVLIRGICAVLFGLAAFFWPGITIAVLVIWFGIYALLDGVFSLVSAFRAASHHSRWWLLLLEGIFGLAAGIFTFMWPGNTALILVFIIAAWAVVTGVFEIAGAFSAPWSAGSKWLFGLGGLLSVAFGLLVYFNPIGGALAIVWIIGAYAIAFGILLVALSVNLKKGWAA